MNYVPHKRVRSKKERVKPTKWLILSLIFLSQLFFYTLIRLESSHARNEISKLQQEKQKLQASTTVLIIEKERLRSPERILRIATGDLNLSTPSEDQVIYLDSVKEK